MVERDSRLESEKNGKITLGKFRRSLSFLRVPLGSIRSCHSALALSLSHPTSYYPPTPLIRHAFTDPSPTPSPHTPTTHTHTPNTACRGPTDARAHRALRAASRVLPFPPISPIHENRINGPRAAGGPCGSSRRPLRCRRRASCRPLCVVSRRVV